MNRRGFFRTLGLVAVTPSVVPMVAEKCASVTKWWIPTVWIEQTFNYGTAAGYCLEAKNALTGEIARNAVRLNIGRPWGAARLLREPSLEVAR